MPTALEALFGQGRPTADLMKAAADYKLAVEAAPSTDNGQVDVDITTKTLTKTERLTGRQALVKTFGGNDAQMAAIEAAAAAQLGQDWLQKDITTSSPVPTGLVAFDLEQPSKHLFPVLTPWRNKFPRNKGVGTSHRYKRITGITGSSTGGVGVVHPGFTDATQTNFANPGSANASYYNRPRKISYAGDDVNLPYVQFGLSDETSWMTYFTALGFEDVRALSRQSTLYSSMLMEERVLLYGRGTLGGFSGTLSAPSGTPTGSARTAATGETALTGFTTNVYVKIVAESGEFGVSAASSASAGIGVSAGQVVDITIPTAVTGTTGYKVFVSTGASDPGDAARWLYLGPAFPNGLSVGRTPTQTITLQGALPTSGQSVAAFTCSDGTVVNLATTDGQSASAASYDGVIPWIASVGSTTGYVGKLNAPLSTSSPGAEFQQAFQKTYDNTRADPEEIWMSGSDRVQISNSLKGQSSSNYRLTLTEDQLMGVRLGSMVTGIQNQVQGRVLSIDVHPYMPQGNAVILQNSITIPGVNVPNAWSLHNIQDYMAIDWPVLGMSYDCSVYWAGVMASYAPDRSSMLVGIQPAN